MKIIKITDTKMFEQIKIEKTNENENLFTIKGTNSNETINFPTEMKPIQNPTLYLLNDEDNDKKDDEEPFKYFIIKGKTEDNHSQVLFVSQRFNQWETTCREYEEEPFLLVINEHDGAIFIRPKNSGNIYFTLCDGKLILPKYINPSTFEIKVSHKGCNTTLRFFEDEDRNLLPIIYDCSCGCNRNIIDVERLQEEIFAGLEARKEMIDEGTINAQKMNEYYTFQRQCEPKIPISDRKEISMNDTIQFGNTRIDTKDGTIQIIDTKGNPNEEPIYNGKFISGNVTSYTNESGERIILTIEASTNRYLTIIHSPFNKPFILESKNPPIAVVTNPKEDKILCGTLEDRSSLKILDYQKRKFEQQNDLMRHVRFSYETEVFKLAGTMTLQGKESIEDTAIIKETGKEVSLTGRSPENQIIRVMVENRENKPTKEKPEILSRRKFRAYEESQPKTQVVMEVASPFVMPLPTTNCCQDDQTKTRVVEDAETITHSSIYTRIIGGIKKALKRNL